MKNIVRAILLAALTVSSPVAADAAATQWQDLGGGKARLVAVLDPSTSRLSGVVELELNEGWKTYWREPGDSGIPPQFDFNRSVGFTPDEEVLLPVPERIAISGTVFAGYRGRVAFVIGGQVATDQPDTEIRLELLAGVCEEICIPATASFSLPLAALMASDAISQQAIDDAAGYLPKPPRADFTIETATLSDEDTLEVQARLPVVEGDADLFVEGPAGWYFGQPQLIARYEGKAVFAIDTTDSPEGADLTAQTLRFTLTQDGQGVERKLTPARQE